MRNPLKIVFIAGAIFFAASCARDMATSPVGSTEAAAALVAAPISFDQISTSFVGSSNEQDGFMPSGGPDLNGGHHDGGFGPGWGAFMGGGIGEGWIGGVAFGGGFRHYEHSLRVVDVLERRRQIVWTAARRLTAASPSRVPFPSSMRLERFNRASSGVPRIP